MRIVCRRANNPDGRNLQGVFIVMGVLFHTIKQFGMIISDNKMNIEARDLPPAVTDRACDLTVSQLHTFCQVMREGGYAAAAKVSHLSVPAVWQHIRGLEKAYGVPLFQRVGRRVEPTAAARRLFQHVDGVLVRLESTFELMQQPAAHTTIRLVTGVRMMLEDLAMPLAKFRRRHSIGLSIRQGNERRAEQLLMADKADVALTLAPGPSAGSPLIHYEPAYTVDFLAVSKKSHPYAKANCDSITELAKHALVVTAAGSHGRDALEQAFHREGLTPNIAIETDNSAFTIACVTSGMGVGVLAGRRDGKMCKTLATQSLRQRLGQRSIVFMWRKGRLLTEPLLDLIEEVKKIDAG